MTPLPELPAEAVVEYWQLVRAALVAGGMSKAEATAAAKAYREFMKPAGWALYNTDPEESARYATKYAAWMRKEQEGVAVALKPVKKRTVQPAKTADTLPTEAEISQLPRWARSAFAARCGRRVVPLLKAHWPDALDHRRLQLLKDLEQLESAVSKGVLTTRDPIEVDSTPYLAELPEVAQIVDIVGSAVLSASTIGSISGIEGALLCRAHAARVGVSASVLRSDVRHLLDLSRSYQWTDDTPVPPAVFGPLWPEGPPADWSELPKPTKLKLSVQVPDGLDDAAVREKLQKLTVALARLNVAGGGHGLKLVPPIDFTHEQDKGRADVVREEDEKPKSRGNARRGC
jgi:hypothetical protein